ncbi:MAG: protein-glutamate methylesterase/protein-glutamine glutaminase [Verrucomicrobiota bacterium]
MPQKIKVLIVDDSAVVRKIISDALSKDPEIEVVGTAMDPYIARDKIVELDPDVITLDIEMPRMDGLTFLKILMQHKPIPVILISALSKENSEYAMKALQYGAVEVMAKPGGSFSVGELTEQLIDKVKAAAHSRVSRVTEAHVVASTAIVSSELPPHPRQIILMGASTGGTEALKDVLTQLPQNMPGICIVQHIPAYFSKAFAERLDSLCKIEVREAVDGDVVKPGLALIAPGDYHMLLRWTGAHYSVQIKQGPTVWHQRPAVDVLFSSAVECVQGHATIAAIFTGMGKDGAEGMLKLKKLGATTFAQSEETCVVYGMPRAAKEIGAADHTVHLQDFPRALVEAVVSTRPSTV